MIELRHLRYFIAVAEELHFGRAADRLHMAQPPLSQQIRQLEAELGFQLLYRTKRSVALTEAGQVFLEDCRKIFRQLDQGSSDGGSRRVGENWGNWRSPSLARRRTMCCRRFCKRFGQRCHRCGWSCMS